MLNSSFMFLGSFKTSAEWCVMEFPVKKNVLYYACCEEPYVDLTYTLRIERKPLSYVFNLILPCICITVLTVLSFCLPPESGNTMQLVENKPVFDQCLSKKNLL